MDKEQIAVEQAKEQVKPKWPSDDSLRPARKISGYRLIHQYGDEVIKYMMDDLESELPAATRKQTYVGGKRFEALKHIVAGLVDCVYYGGFIRYGRRAKSYPKSRHPWKTYKVMVPLYTALQKRGWVVEYKGKFDREDKGFENLESRAEPTTRFLSLLKDSGLNPGYIVVLPQPKGHRPVVFKKPSPGLKWAPIDGGDWVEVAKEIDMDTYRESVELVEAYNREYYQNLVMVSTHGLDSEELEKAGRLLKEGMVAPSEHHYVHLIPSTPLPFPLYKKGRAGQSRGAFYSTTGNDRNYPIENKDLLVIKSPLYRVVNLDRGKEVGGRWYGTFYQQISEELRKSTTINFQPTIESDYSGMHIGMLLNMVGKEITEDPYTRLYGHGTTKRDRQHLKKFWKRVAICCICSRPKVIKGINYTGEGLAVKAITRSINLGEIPSIGIGAGEAVRRFKAAYPELAKTDDRKETPYLFTGGGIQLQYYDSQIAARIIRRLLFEHGVFPLAIHDSFIVQEEYRDLLYQVMREEYNQVMRGVTDGGDWWPVIP